MLRTPEDRFENLPGYDFEPHYLDVPNEGTDALRMHYVDEGPRDGDVILLLHGQASWAYLYRNMISLLTAAGFRVVAPDYIGFGRSDKLASEQEYSFQSHVDWLKYFMTSMSLKNVTPFMFDWGGMFGMRIAAENPEFFDRLVLSNTTLPRGPQPRSDEFLKWRDQVLSLPVFPISDMVAGGVVAELQANVLAAYEAPFPDESYKAGPRSFPSIMPFTEDSPAVPANRAAWETLGTWQKPVLTLFSERIAQAETSPTMFHDHMPGAKDQPHVLLTDASYYMAEDKPKELAGYLIDFASR